MRDLDKRMARLEARFPSTPNIVDRFGVGSLDHDELLDLKDKITEARAIREGQQSGEMR